MLEGCDMGAREKELNDKQYCRDVRGFEKSITLFTC